MCDWDAEEYAEYLLWVGAESTRAAAAVRWFPAEVSQVASPSIERAPAPLVA